MEYFPLTDSVSIPALGLGTWKLRGKTCYKAIRDALNMGYRHIDTADRYKNHKIIGKAIKDSDVPRFEIFITTKVWWSDLHKEKLIRKAHRFLRELCTDYIDLLLIHWPNKKIPLKESLEAMWVLRESGKIRTFGVSNFTQHHLQDALDLGFQVTNNQVEFHPSFTQYPLKEFCDQNGIVLTAYSPLGQGLDLTLPVIEEIARSKGCSPAQVILRWLVSRGIAAVPKATDTHYMKENLQSLEVSLSEEELKKIDSLNKNNRLLALKFAEFDY